MKRIQRLAACLLIALLLAGTFTVTDAEAALKAPGNCRFTRWNDKNYTSCRISWNKVSGADYYEIGWSHTDGSHYQHRYQYGKYNVLDMTGLPYNRIIKVQVRAIDTNSKGKIKGYGAWSNVAYITPLPRKLTLKLKSSGKVKLSWTQIHSARGYQVYMTTKPTGKWYLVKTTAKKSSANSVTISKYRGSKLKKNTSYYVRIVPRLKSGGKYQSIYVPNGYYQGGFHMKTVMK